MSVSKGYDVRIFQDRVSMDHAAADLVAERSRTAVASRGVFSLALSGGATPRGLYGLLASEAYRGRIDWGNIHVFWADERCVPPDHEDSNYRLAADLLLSLVPVPRPNIHRIHGEDEPVTAAAVYDQELRSFFGKDGRTFDLVLLGMGADGHTASLFPEERAVTETGRLAVFVPAAGSRSPRITLTPPVINRAGAVLFLVAGAGKAPLAADILQGAGGSRYPAGLMRPAQGSPLWFLDREAARLLSGS